MWVEWKDFQAIFFNYNEKYASILNGRMKSAMRKILGLFEIALTFESLSLTLQISFF